MPKPSDQGRVFTISRRAMRTVLAPEAVNATLLADPAPIIYTPARFGLGPGTKVDSRIYTVSFYSATFPDLGQTLQFPYATAQGAAPVPQPKHSMYALTVLDGDYNKQVYYPLGAVTVGGNPVWHRLLVPPSLGIVTGTTVINPPVPTQMYQIYGDTGMPANGVLYYILTSGTTNYFLQLSCDPS